MRNQGRIPTPERAKGWSETRSDNEWECSWPIFSIIPSELLRTSRSQMLRDSPAPEIERFLRDEILLLDGYGKIRQKNLERKGMNHRSPQDAGKQSHIPKESRQVVNNLISRVAFSISELRRHRQYRTRWYYYFQRT